MGTNVTFKVVTPENFDKNPAYNEGQLLFVHDTTNKIGQIYLDYGGERVKYTIDPGMNYVGISTTDPSKDNGQGPVTIDGKVLQPRLKDVVVYGKKEYMWRKDEDDNYNLKWMEIGDEESPDWLDDNGNEWST